jgi:hypothetical protein
MFNEWYLENKEVLAGVDPEWLRIAWQNLEDEGVSDETIVAVFGQILTAFFRLSIG